MQQPAVLALRRVVDEPSYDILDALDDLRRDALSGRLIGAAIVCQYKGGTYVVDTCGVARANKLATIGMVEMLSSRLKAEELGL
jgi:hypothetical protein